MGQKYTLKIYGENHYNQKEREFILERIRNSKPDFVLHELLYGDIINNRNEARRRLTNCKDGQLCDPRLNKDLYELCHDLNIPFIGIDLEDIDPKLPLKDKFLLREKHMVDKINQYRNKGNVIVVVGDTHLRTVITKELGDKSYLQKKLGKDSLIIRSRNERDRIGGNDMVLFRDYEPVTEKFRGSNHKELKIIEAELGKLVNHIRKSLKPLMTDETWTLPNDINTESLSNSKSNKIIEEQFKKLFNLKEFMLTWDFAPAPNAFTPCRTFQLISSDKGDVHNGKQKVFVGVFVSTGLITYCNMDEKEILAIILHEIGHNFYNSVFQVLSRMSLSIALTTSDKKIKDIIFADLQSLAINDVLKISVVYTKVLATVKKLISKLFPNLNKISYVIKDFLYNLTSISQRQLDMEILQLPNLLHHGKLFTFRNLFLYNVEKHADSFAVDYGYGVHLASALEKLSIKENTMGAKLYEIPVLNWVLDLFNVQFEIFSLFLSGYPSEQNRIRTGLDRLRRASKDKTLPPKLRKELESQIEEYEDFYENHYMSIMNDKNKRKVFTWMYHSMIETVFKGKMDARELFHAIDPYKYK